MKKKTWRLAWDTVFIIAVCTNDKIWNIPGCEVELFLMHNSILNSATKAGWHIVDFNWIKLLVPDFETSAQAYFTSLLVYIFMFCLCNLSTLLVYVFVCMLNKKKKKVDSFSIRSALCQWNAGLQSIMDILYTAKHCPCILTLFILWINLSFFKFFYFPWGRSGCVLSRCVCSLSCVVVRVFMFSTCAYCGSHALALDWTQNVAHKTPPPDPYVDKNRWGSL